MLSPVEAEMEKLLRQRAGWWGSGGEKSPLAPRTLDPVGISLCKQKGEAASSPCTEDCPEPNGHPLYIVHHRLMVKVIYPLAPKSKVHTIAKIYSRKFDSSARPCT